jgi:hypothetical protein
MKEFTYALQRFLERHDIRDGDQVGIVLVTASPETAHEIERAMKMEGTVDEFYFHNSMLFPRPDMVCNGIPIAVRVKKAVTAVEI